MLHGIIETFYVTIRGSPPRPFWWQIVSISQGGNIGVVVDYFYDDALRAVYKTSGNVDVFLSAEHHTLQRRRQHQLQKPILVGGRQDRAATTRSLSSVEW